MNLRTFIFLFFSVSVFAQQGDFNKAEAYFKNEKFDKAKPLFLSYLKSHPNDKATREYLGDIASYKKDWDEAIDYFEFLVEASPKNADFHYKYGGALGMKALSISRIRALTYIDDIKSHFTKAAELDEKHIETRWALVELYLQLPGIIGGSTRKANEYAMQLQQISPVDGYLTRGYVAEYEGDLEEAEELYKKAIAVGGSPTTYAKLIALYEKDNEPEKALETATKSFKIHERNQINYQIGKISAQYNMEPQLGLASLKQYISNFSVQDGAPLSWAHFRMAQIYRNLGDKPKAVHYIKLSLSELPEFDKALEEKEKIDSM